MEKKILVVIILLLSLMSNYAYCEVIKPYSNEEELMREHSPVLTIEYVIKKAKEYAKGKGLKLENYFVLVVKYDSSEKEWYVSFEGRLPMPGNHFGVYMEDRTEEIELMRGM